MADRVLSPQQWGAVQPNTGWQFRAGFLTGGAVADVFGYHPGNGSLWIGRNNGTGFTFEGRGNVSPAAGWQFVVGDFTSDDRDDIVGYNPANGELWVGQDDGTTFQLQRRATVQPATGWQFGAGHFTAGAKADLFAYHPNNGSLWVGINTGTGFDFQQWGSVTPASGWQFVTADFTGNGRPDIAGYETSSGALWVGENTGNAFRFSRWGTVVPATGWQLRAGFFTSRDKADLLAYHPNNGSVWVGENTGTLFSFQQWATAQPATGWQFDAGSFDGDLWVDAFGYQDSDGTLWVWRSMTRPIEGYCWPLSAAPGERISFMTSGGGTSRAAFRRHTSVSSAVESVTLDSLDFASDPQATQTEPYRSGCGWAATFTLDVPAAWTSGFYSAACTDESGQTSDITFVVKAAPTQRSQIALLANVNTWLAYNGWGGQSKYSGLARTSFLRPMPSAAPTVDAHLTRGELWIQGWLELEGHRPDMLSDIDFHNDGCDPGQYALLVVGTHPEYWSTQMYDNLVAYLNDGGSFAYLGGNGLFETGTYDANGTQMVFRAGVEGGQRGDALFRVISPPRPERAVLGVATERCTVPGSPYEVRLANHSLFAGTGVANGTIFGDSGLNTGFGNGKASAWEVDTTDGIGATGLPWDCGMDDQVTIRPSSLPTGLVVLASGVDDGIGRGADMTYYDHPGGGFVFSAGSLTFGGSLVVDPIIQQVMRNVLAAAGISP